MKNADETSLLDISHTIVDSVFSSLGTSLSAEEACELATELSTFIVRAILRDMTTPMPAAALDAVDEFFRTRGIAETDDEWRWLN